jgi:hypothetical protein
VRSGVSQRTLIRAVIDYQCPVRCHAAVTAAAAVIFAVAIAESVTDG